LEINLNMHILFLTDNFPPEGNAPATRTFEHCSEWVKNKDVQVTVITCVPNFPEGKVYSGYSNKLFQKEVIEGINVWRVKTFISANEGIFKRSIDFLSFMFSSFIFGLFAKKVDCVIGTSPQFFTVISSYGLAKLKRVPFIFELRDMWPASIAAVDVMKKGRIINILESVELFLYKKADLIISVTRSFKTELIKKGINEDKIRVVMNGVDLRRYQPATIKDKDLAKIYGLKDKFVAGYIGTHGSAHALDKIVYAAKILINYPNIRIIFAGGGAERIRITELVKREKLHNIVMIPRQAKEDMPKLWSLCDVSLIHLKDVSLFRTVIPSKIFESMGMGLPIIISVPLGEATKIVTESESGIVVPPESPKDLANAILKLNEPHLYQKLSNGSKNSANKYDRRVLAAKMLSHIKNI
tara:strand:- start:1329 stop:2564 length:1236 start_codon:yes stop_codon:yes gene_type:complete